MHNYKIGLLLFSNSKSELPGIVRVFEDLVKEHSFGVVKATEVLEQKESLIQPILDQYKNTNLGMIVLVAPDADNFFPYSELEEVGHRNEKFLVTLNLDGDIGKNFLKIIQKVKSSKGKPYKGCDSSCR